MKTKSKHLLPYDHAKKFIADHPNRPQSRAEYFRWYDKYQPKFLPRRPNRVYENFSWNDYLNTTNSFLGTIENRTGNRKEWRAMWDAVRYAQSIAKTFSLSTSTQWIEYCKSNRPPDDIPIRPDHAYKEHFCGWKVWLGVDPIHHIEKEKNSKRIFAIHHAVGMPINCIVAKVYGTIDEVKKYDGKTYRLYRVDQEDMRIVNHLLSRYAHKKDQYMIVPNMNALISEMDLDLEKMMV